MNDSTINLEAALSTNDSLRAEVASLKELVASLQEQIAWFQKNLFGKRSEKLITSSPDQPLLFDYPAQESCIKEQKVAEHVRRIRKEKGGDKISFPEDLPVERIVIDLKEEEKICPETNKPLVKIGEEVSQKLAQKPGSFYIKEIIRPKYASPKGATEAVFVAPVPESLLTRCKADESFLADILVKKFADHLPLYRQSEMLARYGIHVSRQILSKWVVKCGLALKPLYEEMQSQILKSKNLFIDEVPVDMLSPGKGQVHQAYMWVLVGGLNTEYRIYNFRMDRSHKNAEELLRKTNDSIVHSDKYGAYEALACQKLFTWCPCWAHIRRKFFEGQAGDSDFVKFVLRKIKYLFMLERVAWNRSEKERLQIRQEKEIPIIDELILHVKDKLYNGSPLPQSKFKEALSYFIGLIPYLKNYTKHPYSRLDNNIAERAVRPLALGRKNWLFLGSEEGGEAAAVILSLVQTCRTLKINPYEYLEDVMRRLMSHSFKALEELLPGKWVKAQTFTT
jgi:transposase